MKPGVHQRQRECGGLGTGELVTHLSSWVKPGVQERGGLGTGELIRHLRSWMKPGVQQQQQEHEGLGTRHTSEQLGEARVPAAVAGAWRSWNSGTSEVSQFGWLKNCLSAWLFPRLASRCWVVQLSSCTI